MLEPTRLWKNVEVGGFNDCWPWTKKKDRKGYGRFYIGIVNGVRKWTGAHQVAFALANGPIPPSMEIDHTCCNPLCCNARHMEIVTHAENMKRIWARKRGRTGHGLGEDHPRARFTREQVEAIKADPRSGRALARELGCNKSLILRIRSGRTYQQDGVFTIRHT